MYIIFLVISAILLILWALLMNKYYNGENKKPRGKDILVSLFFGPFTFILVLITWIILTIKYSDKYAKLSSFKKKVDKFFTWLLN